MGDLGEEFRGRQDLKNHLEGAAFLAEEITFGRKVISVKIARWRKVCVCMSVCDVQVNFSIPLRLPDPPSLPCSPYFSLRQDLTICPGKYLLA